MQNIYTIYRNKPMLVDVVILRLVLIFLLIGTHTFAPYAGGTWEQLPVTVDAYKYINSITHYISMPALIFISGYLFGHAWQKTKNQSLKSFIIKKIKRLIVPSIVFSIFYYLFFYDTKSSIVTIVYSIINGCGHLWFLPMLFWCFVVCYLINKSNFPVKIVIPILLIVSVLPIPSLPLRITQTCAYLIFFYLGSVLQTSNKDFFINNLALFFISLFAYIGSLVLFHSFSEAGGAGFIVMLQNSVSLRFIKLMLGLCGIGIAYSSTRLFLQTGVKISQNVILISTYCFGVYIFHQFIVKFFYYHTSLPTQINPYLLPFICFIVTLIISLLLTGVFLKTKPGRYLIG